VLHLSQYRGLSVEAHQQVWKTFLDGMTKAEDFTEEQINALAEIELNGRQIKNILKTAQLLVIDKDASLEFEDVQIVTRLRAAHACIPLKGR
jgi:hypothetical protein